MQFKFPVLSSWFGISVNLQPNPTVIATRELKKTTQNGQPILAQLRHSAETASLD